MFWISVRVGQFFQYCPSKPLKWSTWLGLMIRIDLEASNQILYGLKAYLIQNLFIVTNLKVQSESGYRPFYLHFFRVQSTEQNIILNSRVCIEESDTSWLISILLLLMPIFLNFSFSIRKLFDSGWSWSNLALFFLDYCTGYIYRLRRQTASALARL